MYSITYRKPAAKALTKLPAEVSSRFVAGFQKLANGETEGLDIKKLTGRQASGSGLAATAPCTGLSKNG